MKVLKQNIRDLMIDLLLNVNIILYLVNIGIFFFRYLGLILYSKQNNHTQLVIISYFLLMLILAINPTYQV